MVFRSPSGCTFCCPPIHNFRQYLHNAGKNSYTSPFKPWRLIFYAAFEDEQRARDFEKYLKTGSGAAFGNKRLW